LLEGLGVVNGSVFLSQSQIWVEGPSDIIYFRAYLKSLEAEREAQRGTGDDGARGARFERLLENRDFVFVMYGGSLLDTIDFARDSTQGTSPFAIGDRIFVIADADSDAAEAKREKHERLQELAADSKGMMVYRKLDVREVENTVAPVHLRRAMQSLYQGMRKVSDEAVFDVPEDELIGHHFEGAGVESIGSYVSKSGSWNEKTRLARGRVCEAPLPWGELRPSTRTLALELDAFIRRACAYEQPPWPPITP
jgi:hypothetical protein